MKKILSVFSFLILFTAFTCDNEPLEGDFVTEDPTGSSCQEAILATAQAALAFVEVTDENYTQLCNAYRTAIENQITACGDADGSLAATLNALGDCSTSDGVNECALANSAVSAAQSAFNNANNDNYTELCNAYRSALENLIVQCGEDGGTQSEINDLGDCTNNSQDDASVVGEWLLIEWNLEEPVDFNEDGVADPNLVVELDCYQNERIVFNADNTGVIMSTSYADIGFEIEVGTTDSYIYSTACILEDENTGITWTQNGNVVTVTDEFDIEYDYIINGNQMTVVVPDGYQIFNEDFTSEIIQDLTFVFVKQ